MYNNYLQEISEYPKNKFTNNKQDIKNTGTQLVNNNRIDWFACVFFVIYMK